MLGKRVRILALLLAVPVLGHPANAQATSPARSEKPLAQVELLFPLGLALAPDGSLYISERQAHRVRRVDLGNGTVTVIAGTGERGFSGDGGPAAAAQLGCPDSIDLDAAGNLYIADRCNERIRRVDARTGVISTIAGNGKRGQSPDGPALEIPLMGVFYVNALSPGELIFTDTDSNRVRRLDLRTGNVTTLAGSGERGFSGDGGPALEAAMYRPHVAVRARNGDIIIGDSFNQRIRRVDSKTGVIRTVAGKGEQGLAADGTPALEALFAFFGEIIEMPDGDLLVTEWVNGRLLRIGANDQRVHVLAGTGGDQAAQADGSPPKQTRLGRLADMVIDRQGRILVNAAQPGVVRRIDLKNGTVETVVGPPPTS